MEYDFKDLQAKIEADKREPEGATSYDDSHIYDDTRNARVVHTRIRCSQLIPERDEIDFWVVRFEELYNLAGLEEKYQATKVLNFF